MFPFAFSRDRPAAVTVLVILHVILGIIAAFTAVILFVAFGRPISLGSFTAFAVSVVGVAASYGYLIVAVGALWLVFTVFAFVLVYGLWTARGWAYTTALVLGWNGLIIAALGLALGIFANALALAVYVLILIYMILPSVRLFFGRVQTFPAPYPSYPIPTGAPTSWGQPRYYTGGAPPFPTAHQRMPPQANRGPIGRLCPNCRTISPYNASFCNVCGIQLS